MSNNNDEILIAYVNHMINTGKTKIQIPDHLLRDVSKEALETVRQLMKLSGVSPEIVVK